jgi:hypothetical protein
MRRPPCGAVAAIGLALAICGCGNGDGGEPTTAKTSPQNSARADANCERLRRQVVRLGRRAFPGAPVPSETTARIVRPSLALLESFADRQQLLARASEDSAMSLYARLFEPIIVLAHERLRAGAQYAAGDSAASTLARGYENLMATVADEQREAAQRAGLDACAIDFTKVLTRSLAG